MVKAYEYVYYRIYLWGLKAYGEQDRPHDSAVLGVALLTYLNILTLFAILQGITGIKFSEIGGLSVEYLAVLAVCYMVLHYFILFRKKRYKQIIVEHSQESEEKHKKGTIWVIAYIVGTPIALIVSTLIASQFA